MLYLVTIEYIDYFDSDKRKFIVQAESEAELHNIIKTELKEDYGSAKSYVEVFKIQSNYYDLDNHIYK